MPFQIGADQGIRRSGKWIVLFEKEDTANVLMVSRPYDMGRLDFYRQFRGIVLDFDLVHEGTVSVPGLCTRIEAASTSDRQQEWMLLESGGQIGVYEFADTNWILLATVPLVSDDSTMPSAPWAVGDVNNDGSDEIVVAADSNLACHTWSREGTTQVSYRLPGLVDDLLIGDVTNDARNELLALCYDKPLHRDEPGCRYSLCVASVDRDRLTILWTDGGELGYIKSNLIPSDNLVCVGDVVNVGINQLVLAEGQSDPCPTRYHLLSWMENDLNLAKTFIVSEGRIMSEGHEEKRPHMLGDILPLKTDDRTVVLTTMVYQNAVFMPAVVTMEDETFTQLGVVPRAGPRLANSLCWADPDGKGKGILGIPGLRGGECKYVFYRVVPRRGCRW